MQYAQLQRAMAGGERVFEVLDTKPDIVDAPDAVEIDDIKGRVDFDHVDFDYVEDVPVLRDINLHVQPGETVALVGQTGAGKTTITALILRFYDVTKGRIHIDGIDLQADQPRLADAAHGRGAAGRLPVLRHGEGEHPLRPPGRDGRRGDRGRRRPSARTTSSCGWSTATTRSCTSAARTSRSASASSSASRARSSRGPRILILDEATANVDTHTEVIIQRRCASS